MEIVEENLLNNNEHEEMPDGGGEGWQLIATMVAPPDEQRVPAQIEDKANDSGVEQNSPQTLLVLLPVYLQGWGGGGGGGHDHKTWDEGIQDK